MINLTNEEHRQLLFTDEVYAHLWITAVWEWLHEDPSVTQEDWRLYAIVREELVHCSLCDIPKSRGRIAAIREHSRIYRETHGGFAPGTSDSYLK